MFHDIQDRIEVKALGLRSGCWWNRGDLGLGLLLTEHVDSPLEIRHDPRLGCLRRWDWLRLSRHTLDDLEQIGNVKSTVPGSRLLRLLSLLWSRRLGVHIGVITFLADL